MSKFCTMCGKELNDDSQFCDKCGTPQKINSPVNIETTGVSANIEMGATASSPVQNNPDNKMSKGGRIVIAIAIFCFVIALLCGIGFIFTNIYKGTKVNEEMIKTYVSETIKTKYSSIYEIKVEKEDNNNYNVYIEYKNHESKIKDVATLVSLSNYSIKYLIGTNSDYNKYIKNVTFSVKSPENGYYFIYKDFKNMSQIEDAETIGPNLTIEDLEHKKVEIDMKAEMKANRREQMEKYKAQCETYDYKTISRYPDEYKGKKAKFTGKVMQVIEGNESITYYRVNITKTTYQYLDIETWDDTIYVTYLRLGYNKDFNVRVLKDDIINIYGELDGLESYESVLGTTITIPAITAEYIELVE